MRVTLLVLDGVFDSGLSVLLDTLATANDLGEGGPRSGRFSVTIGALRRQVRTAHGMSVPTVRIDAGDRPDVVLLPAMGAKTPETIAAALERPDVVEAAALVREWSSAGVRVGGACTATFLLAATGILDGGRATTTWWLSPLFRALFPAVTLDDSRMVVESNRVVTAGAALAHVDLALWLIRRKSPSLAQLVARYLVTDERSSQASFALPDHLVHADPVVERFEEWARRHLKSFSLPAAAKAIGASERTLERRTRSVLGKTPVAYVRELRVESAVHRLRTTKESLDQIAAAVGYEDAVTLRTLLRRKTGRTVRELRGGSALHPVLFEATPAAETPVHSATCEAGRHDELPRPIEFGCARPPRHAMRMMGCRCTSLYEPRSASARSPSAWGFPSRSRRRSALDVVTSRHLRIRPWTPARGDRRCSSASSCLLRRSRERSSLRPAPSPEPRPPSLRRLHASPRPRSRRPMTLPSHCPSLTVRRRCSRPRRRSARPRANGLRLRRWLCLRRVAP